jgi:AraC family transcriptional activator of pobA
MQPQERSAMQRSIPQYSLYGEAIQDVDERFLHVESIAERSRLHDWTIRPHAHRYLHHLLLIQRGGGTLNAEGEEHAFGPPALVEVPVSCVHSFQFQPGTDGWIVTTSGALMGRLAREHAPLSGVLQEAGTMALPSETAAELDLAFEALVTEFHGQLPARRAAVEARFTTILIHTLRCKLALAPDPHRAGGADTELAARFRALVEKNFAKPHRVADYADRLCVSHERLRQACVRSTASSPLELLNARRLLEAKRCLLYTSMSVALIAEHCGFEDPAYFSRFFARAAGKSPLQYRKTQSSRQRDS